MQIIIVHFKPTTNIIEIYELYKTQYLFSCVVHIVGMDVKNRNTWELIKNTMVYEKPLFPAILSRLLLRFYFIDSYVHAQHFTYRNH